MKRYVVTPDKHFPLADKKAISVLCKTIEMVKPDGYIDLGDTGEWAGASHWQWKKKAKPSLEWYLPAIITDIDDVNKGMDIIDESLDKANVKEKHFICGNHDKWMDYFVEEYPYLPQYSIKTAIKIKERGYTFHEAGKLLKLGDINFYHGHNYGGMHHAANHLRRYGENIMYGHHHDIQVYTDTSANGPITAYSIGCLKSLKPEDNDFCRNRPINWKQAFAIVDIAKNGQSFVDLVQINNGKAVVYGEIIE
jgi:hypothetical protein